MEFYNPGPDPADLSGSFISNERDLPGFIIPPGTILAPGAYLAFPAGVLGFVFDEMGDEIFLRAPDGLQVIAARKLGAQETGYSRGGADPLDRVGKSHARLAKLRSSPAGNRHQ